jgi:hypothetical protein
VAGAVQHLFLAERQRLFGLQNQQALEYFRDLQKVALLHLLGVLFEAIFPILALAALAQVLITGASCRCGSLCASPHGRRAKGNHYGEAAGGKAESRNALAGGKGAAADILDRRDPVIGVNYPHPLGKSFRDLATQPMQ